MVPPKAVTVKEALAKLREYAVDVNDYAGGIADVAFEIVTADTFLAGIADSWLSGAVMDSSSRVIVIVQRLLDGRIWVAEQGQRYDLSQWPELLEYARRIESLRKACEAVL
jgi:hypothetical protein